jgi:urease accessory protein
VAPPQRASGGYFLIANPEPSTNPYGRLSTLRAEAFLREGKTVLRDISFTAPLKLLPPHPAACGSSTAVQLSVSAGLMAGDRQEIRLAAGKGTRLTWTSQSFEKIHKMEEGTHAERDCTITVAEGAFLRFRPLPVIPFAGSDFRGRTRVDLADESAALIYSDIFCAGRVARLEIFRFRRFRQLLEIRRAGQLIYRDNMDLRPALRMESALLAESAGSAADLSGLGLFEGYTHLASLVLCNTGTGLAQIREILAAADKRVAAAATALAAPNTFLVKALGHSAEELEELTLIFLNRT